MKCCSIRAVANTSLMISLCCRADFLTIRTYLQQCEGNMWTTSEQHHPRIKQTYIANRVAQGVRPWDDARWDDRYKKQWTGRNQKKFATILQHQTMNGGPQTIETELPDVLHTHGPLRSERPDETFRPESQWLTHWSVVATWSQTCCAHLKNWQRFVTHILHTLKQQAINPRLSRMISTSVHPLGGYPPGWLPSISTQLPTNQDAKQQPTHETCMA